MEYVYINEVIGRSEYAQKVFGTLTHQDSITLNEYASDKWKQEYLAPLVNGEVYPSFAMTEPEVASSNPTQLQTHAVLEDGHWVINGRKWFTTGADEAAYTIIMCRTEDAPPHKAFSMIVVPTNVRGYNIIRDTSILGMNSGYFEVEYDNIRVPEDHILGNRGEGFLIAQKRLGRAESFIVCVGWARSSEPLILCVTGYMSALLLVVR